MATWIVLLGLNLKVKVLIIQTQLLSITYPKKNRVYKNEILILLKGVLTLLPTKVVLTVSRVILVLLPDQKWTR